MKFLTIIFEFSIIASFAITNFSLSTNLLSTLKTPPYSPLPIDEKTHLDSRLDQESESFGDDVTDFPLLLDKTNHLPDACDDWWNIRNYNKVYVDKTDILDYLIRHGRKLHFCTRPRRFGKSLFAQMVGSYFTGEKVLFDGTKISKLRNGNIIHSKPNGSWIQYPIIKLNFAINNESLNEFKESLQSNLNLIANIHEMSHPGNITLTDLIVGLRMKFKLPVIIIIEEYDKPINNAIFENNKPELAENLAKIINNVLNEIKSNTEYIEFAWITGVTRLPVPPPGNSGDKIEDLTYDPELAGLAGFTKTEIQHYFKSDIKSFAEDRKVNEEEIMEALQTHYDGYRFSVESSERVYNPISVIKTFRKFKIGDFWTCPLGSHEYIMKQIAKGHKNLEYYDNLLVSESDILEKHAGLPHKIPLALFMLQDGYLTIRKCEEGKCWLKLANREIRSSLRNYLEHYIPMKKMVSFKSLVAAFNTKNIPVAINIINQAGFRYFNAPLNQTVKEVEVTRRLIALLNIHGILCEGSEQFFWGPDPLFGKVTKGIIDIRTRNLEINCAIEIKCGNFKDQQISKGVKQQLNYLTKDDETQLSFLQKLGTPYDLSLLTIHFDPFSGGRIDGWVFIPCRGGKLMLKEMQTSSEELSKNIASMIKTSYLKHISN